MKMQAHHHEMVRANLRLVGYYLHRYGGRLLHHGTSGELRAEAHYWLCQAALAWESPRGVTFAGFALRLIVRGVYREITRDQHGRYQELRERAEERGGLTGPVVEWADCNALPDRRPNPLDVKADRELIAWLMAGLSSRNRAVMETVYALDGRGKRSCAEVMKTFGISRERVRQIVRACEAKMRERAANAGLLVA